MSESRGLDDLLTEAINHPIRGWDFSWLRDQGRIRSTLLPWDYTHLVSRKAADSPDLLDIGTGGGEILASLPSHPPLSVATESYAPNVLVAARRLTPLGVQVVHTTKAIDNALQGDCDLSGRLPFRDGAFHLVTDRNEAFNCREVARILAPGGTFLTEQSGSSDLPDLYRLLDLPVPPHDGRSWTLELARTQVTRAGQTIVDSGESEFEVTFSDVGALVWYLLAVPWVMPNFSVEPHYEQLEALHDRVRNGGPIRIHRYGFWLEATKD